jgi:fibronectin type 3 domain-containing protein
MTRFVLRRPAVLVLATIIALTGQLPLLQPGRSAAAAFNLIPNENAQPGTTDWQIDYGQIAQKREIEGYASAASVNQGGSINIMVSVTKPQPYTIKVYRMGYYGGAGARLMTTIGPLQGVYQGLPTAGPAPTYLIEAKWPVAYTLNVPTSWVSGYYLAKLIRNDGFARYVIFVVRNDSDPAPIVMASTMTTYQAYNDWGGFSLYGQFNYNYTSSSFGQPISNGPMAAEVSFDRPYDNIDEGDGAGEFFNWEYSMVRYMEKEGRWVTYVSDVDLQSSNVLSVAGRNTFLSVGHDEYWSGEARTTVTNARQAGMNLLWLSGNQVWWKIRYGSDAAGNPNRDIFCNKNGDSLTGYWFTFLPENELIGSVSGGANWQSPSNYVVTNAGPYSWIYSNTGLSSGSSINGLVGKEYEVTSPNNGYQPVGLQIIAHSPTSDGGVSDAVAYTATSGAVVINMGTFQWSWGLDSYSSIWSQKAENSVPTSAAAIKVTDNILDRFTGVSGPAPTPPGTPTAVTATAGNASATISWAAPASGGSPITGYRITTSGAGAPAPIIFNSTATSETVTGLTNGNSYTFTIAAINAIGTGSDSAPSNAVVPATVPVAPTGVAATAGVGSASVSWTAPANGGSPITGYRITTTGTGAPAPIIFNSTATTQTISSLTAGNSYTFTVAAINALGTGADSTASNAVTPTANVPGTPTNVTATGGNASATVTWAAPASNGGSSITGYRVTTSGTGAPPPIIFNSTATSETVTGLTNGNSYTFTVAAINAIGTGSDSAPSNAVLPATVPAAPTGVAATAGVGSASVTWTAPVNGGSPITGYRVTTTGTGAPAPTIFNSTATTETISGLTNGNSYTFTVAAINTVGTGADSVASNAITPTATVPGAPTNVTATGGNASATVTWAAPASNGGSPITGYRVTTIGTGAPAPIIFNSTATSETVTGLTNGNSYTFTVAAINAIGTGSDSAASNAVTPTAVAATSLVQAQTVALNLSTTASGAYSQPVSAGDTLVALVGYPGAWGNTVSRVTDTLGNTWTRAVGAAANDACGDDAEIWTARANATGTDNVTIVLSVAAGTWVNWNFTLSEFKGGAVIGSSGADNANSMTHTATASGAAAGNYAVAMYVNCGYNTTIASSSGWTLMGTNTANTSYQTESDQVYQLNLPAGTTSVTFTNSAVTPAEVLVLNLTPTG